MPKKYPRRNIYMSDAEWEMAVWVAAQMAIQSRRSVSVSDALRRILTEKYEAMGGPTVEAEADAPSELAA